VAVERPETEPTVAVERPGTVDSEEHLVPFPRRNGLSQSRVVLSKLAHFVPAMFLFILAIQLMKKGAGALAPFLADSGFFDNGISTLGLGWLGAYIVLSGSPIAATALSFHAADGITPLQTFTMLSGSRLGASFIVLLVGFIYYVRGKDRRQSLGMGVLAMSMTAVQYLPGMMLGYLILRLGWLDGIQWTASGELQNFIDVGWGWAVDLVANNVPQGLLFPIGLAVILVSFKLLDRVLPELDPEKHHTTHEHWLKKPWPMFFLGCVAALLTLSVAVALTVLVPLASKGYLNRREALPYIAGANITTLADTLVAAMLLGKSSGVQVVLAEAIGVAIVTLLLLAFVYSPLRRAVIGLDDWVIGSNRRLYLFVGVLFLVPIALMVAGGLIGPFN
jgi:sodium-dependent phosphate cotransporter